MMPTLETGEAAVLPELPAGWIPEGEILTGFVCQRADAHVWEVTLPEWSIVGRGQSFEEASRQAGELLDDYFRMCAAEGVSYQESRRSMPASWYAQAVAEAVTYALLRRVRRTSERARTRMRVLRVPSDHAFCS